MTAAWYKNAIVYALDVKCFQDSDGDGVGDFTGLTRRLDYLAEVGVTCLWLQPFYPTPNRDDGYDVADFCAVDPRLGTLGDFVALVRAAGERGIRVLVELVVNHTSRDHPWFRSARSDSSSPFRDYYIWLDRPPEPERRGGLVFPGEQVSNWSWDARAGAYYWHWFYGHQPDLNTGNPQVRAEIRKIMAFWLELGVAGFRIDAAPFLFKRKGLAGTFPDHPHDFIIELRRFLEARNPDAVFLAEADVEADQVSFFFGEGERMHLLLNFLLNNYLFAALARERAEPLERGFAALPRWPARCQWANFVRNHDELNLDRLPAEDRQAVFERFAVDSDARIYGRGIRRRIAPMLDGDRRRLEMVYSLLFSLPGVPVLRYGDEIGMGDDLSLPGRLAVRTPMHWSTAPNAGFSDAPGDRLVRPVIRAGPFRFHVVNVESQRDDPGSLLAFVRRLIELRRDSPEQGSGDFKVLDTGDRRAFGHRCDEAGRAVIAVHNLSGEPCEVTLELDDTAADGAEELIGDRRYESIHGPRPTMRLEPFGYRWLRVRTPAGPTDAAPDGRRQSRPSGR